MSGVSQQLSGPDDPSTVAMVRIWLLASCVCLGALALTEHFREIPAAFAALASTWLILRE